MNLSNGELEMYVRNVLQFDLGYESEIAQSLAKEITFYAWRRKNINRTIQLDYTFSAD